MKNAWFHKRGPGEGTGYGVKNVQGAVVTAVFLVLVAIVAMSAFYVPELFHTSPLVTLIGVMGAAIVLLIVFLAIVMTHSDARHKK